MTLRSQERRIAIIGGGIAGATAAVHLAELGLNVLLIEKGAGLVNGPPICHLHAGGNLYREISEQQCIELLEQSIETVRLYPHTLNVRPTIITVPKSDPGEPQAILARLMTIQNAYRTLVEHDGANQVLGEVEHYYRAYQRDELEHLAKTCQANPPRCDDDWMVPFAQHVDLDQLKYPVVLVQEYGWSVFRLAASVELTLAELPNCQVMTRCELIDAQYHHHQWQLTYIDDQGQQQQQTVDYLVNACGFETGRIDDMAGHQRQRLVEFKAAYVTQWPDCHQWWPEVIFHGPRGSEAGMAQLTPYADGTFQLHGMTQAITLFDDGLVSSSPTSAQPQLPSYLQHKIEHGWPLSAQQQRTQSAVEHMSRFVPAFSSAQWAATPLFGAQQIPGDDVTLRAADVSFEANQYARLEVVKGSSALRAARQLVAHWQLHPTEQRLAIEAEHPVSLALTAEQVEQHALSLSQARGYPVALAKVYGSKP
ncbi:FAD-dependent oxidoreductase (plasmid) [Vibrio sp. HDW18]|uniref:FAD-dependent oxidoreductase n=1 Tax=Vibrio sp. HDW18 TaxID=2714948 RepID=UPI00140E07B9|nr:FAD-dependent oxidoreductase [Vibrio sp. HDW18]QIL86851.1 FAD-dependent oxidoreductase [Vibrio sp. HDW18]